MRMRARYVNLQIASARGVADRWASQYQHPKDGWASAGHAGAKDKHESLVALGPNPPIERVTEIIGNKSWSYINCDGCGDYVERAIAIGEYESKSYCTTCIREAAAIMDDMRNEMKK